MKTVDQAIKKAEQILPGVPAPEGEIDPRWQAIIKVGEFIETNPKEVWYFIRKWGVHPNEDLRMAIATCLLEHLLQYHFKDYFPKVQEACRDSKRFRFTFRMSSQFGQTKWKKNSKLYHELRKKYE
ncbi:MAG: hypothetical protein PHE50_08935 [Dehalococcoidales bacterium]|nr:hypothetical protein [Dehalococcoidales bacterium]